MFILSVFTHVIAWMSVHRSKSARRPRNYAAQQALPKHQHGVHHRQQLRRAPGSYAPRRSARGFCTPSGVTAVIVRLRPDSHDGGFAHVRRKHGVVCRVNGA